ncbi:MAG: phosphoenolpyruvate--protein phosphotransferase [Deltaproteobacteria bacterium]|nr:phosphoenolpyruvate--protein phosphotransferase [Deltaproteobacteria bacterium]MBN2845224.1 phosphoenolpyruvate--protein phosphotransferase [Deltaproteobacteria bacterium]
METDAIRSTVVLKGIGVSPGIVSGRAYVLDFKDVETHRYKLGNDKIVSEEIERFRKALKDSEEELLAIRENLEDSEGIGPLFIDVHVMILKDGRFIQKTMDNIKEGRINAEWALGKVISEYRQVFEKIKDGYIKERIKDVEDVAQRIFRNLSGDKLESISDIKEEVIIIARDLSPADTVQMTADKVLGFATDVGSKTSHTAIVARSMEIPASVGLENVTAEVATGDTVIIDGTSGMVIINPDPEILKRYEEKKKYYMVMEEGLLKGASLPAKTKDGYSIGIGANIEFIEEIPSAVAHGANGVGLYRTEFIYINKESLPTEDEHFYHYKSIVEGKGIKWSTIRTFDLGGDKFISDPRLADEMNPAMGLRAVRYCLREVGLFKVQIRAILRASAYGNTGILIPMISGLEEIRAVKKIIAESKEELKKEGIPFSSEIKLGIMIEVPSAVVIAEDLAKEVDFFSIGTNDLIQYSLAIDRVNERVDYLYKPCHPAILRLIRQVVDAGHREGIKVAMCGEMAGDPVCTLILLGFELDGLSMTPLAIPRVKKIIRESTQKESKELLERLMSFSGTREIEEYLRNYMSKRFPDECPISYE